MKYFSLLKMTALFFYCCTISCNCGNHCSHHDTAKQASIKTLPGLTRDSGRFCTQHSCYEK